MPIFERYGAVTDLFPSRGGFNPRKDPTGFNVETYETETPTETQMRVVFAAASKGADILKKVGVDVVGVVQGTNYADIVFRTGTDPVLAAWIAAPRLARFDDKAHVKVLPPQEGGDGRWFIRFVREDLNIDFRAHMTI